MSGPWINPPSGRNAQTFDSPTFTGQIKGVTYNALSNGIPFINISSGTMGNNGALSAITALDTTYSDGAWCLFPAGAIAAGVPAAATWYWVTFSSTTAGTVWNSTYSSGQPTIGTQTAFSTTGPGAYTGVTGAMDAISVSIPGNSLGSQGFIDYDMQGDCNSNANGKNLSSLFGATTFATLACASALSGRMIGKIQNRGLTNRQVGNTIVQVGGLGTNNSAQTVRGSNDTTGTLTFKVQTNKATATDNLILSALNVDVSYRA